MDWVEAGKFVARRITLTCTGGGGGGYLVCQGICIGSARKTPIFNPHAMTKDPIFSMVHLIFSLV